MAKNNVESYEEDDFLMEEQNSNEEAIAEEDEDIDDDSTLKIKARPARASSLTHSAIKSEILKMNKQKQLDSGEENDDQNLSRSARKRKKRREKVLEERRASGGRSDNFEDDLAHFKSIPISRRRSSVLPLQTISLNSNHNNEDGFCSMLKCCLWIFLVGLTLIGLLYVWPTVAELELTDPTLTDPQSGENLVQPQQVVNNEIDDGEQIINQINKLDQELNDNQDDNQIDNNQNEEESFSTFSYLSSFLFEKTSEQPIEQQATEDELDNNSENNDQKNDEVENFNENEQNNNEPTVDDVDEGFDEQQVLESNDDEKLNTEDLAESVPSRYQNAVQDNLDDENDNSCVIGGQIYNNLDNSQCSLLQARHHQLEQQLREQEQSIRQEQQEHNDEQYSFFS